MFRVEEREKANQKVTLTRYREETKKIFAVFSKYCSLVEKASCDDWCVRMDTGRIISLARTDNHLDFETEAIFRYPAKTQVGMGTSELKVRSGAVQSY